MSVSEIDDTTNMPEQGISAMPVGQTVEVSSGDAAMVDDSGFKLLNLPILYRPDAYQRVQYNVYSDEFEFKTVDADNALEALAMSDSKPAFKVVNAHCRIDDIIGQSLLEIFKKSEHKEEEDKEQTSESEES